ncbi:MAG: hypothetical protein OEU86_09930, partial [Gammaproteobacteria bacterium]|nr:hypothetical protein [Gammaproteobacteria bacterium]
YGKINMTSMLAMPLVSVLTAVIMFGPRVDTMVTVFSLNVIPMLLGGAITGLLLRSASKAGGAGRSVALWPVMLPAIIGIAWYLRDALFPAELDPGRVYIAGPQYLLGIAIATGFVAWIICLIIRMRRAES